MLSQFCQNTDQEHWTAAKRVLRYLKGTAKHSLRYEAGDMTELEGYVDSDWAGDPESRRSTSGFIFKLGTGSVSWRSGKQPIVACSTTEAEYIALSEAVREASWLRSLLKELDLHLPNLQLSTKIIKDALRFPRTEEPISERNILALDITMFATKSKERTLSSSTVLRMLWQLTP